jgi:hypothetical protein
VNRRAKRSHDGNSQDERGESHHGVYKSLNNEVGSPTEMNAGNAQDEPYGATDQGTNNAYIQRDPCAKYDSAKHITPQVVATEQHRRAWRGVNELGGSLVRVMGRDDIGEDSDDD